MKIKYTMNRKDSLKVLNDSLGISLNKNNILTSKNVKYMNYLSISILELIISVIFLGMTLLLTFEYYSIISLLLTTFAFCLLIVIILNIIIPILCTNYFFRKDDYELEINEKGIVFNLDDDEQLITGWTHIKGIIVGRYSVNIITDYKYYYYFDKNCEQELINAIKKYHESIVIIK